MGLLAVLLRQFGLFGFFLLFVWPSLVNLGVEC